ncbi:MAG TPA: NADH:flavin oxidoreductase/NADH oxidase [Terracidiphilus sp.]|jgi:2,4-dienoyl-CoA reductase-like NADH-dependent reductase (Old Yellow Enzyme family)|nr:NADH:flavin oxidoreductase/NADH oxidase [Terracidiphilus sp.]
MSHTLFSPLQLRSLEFPNRIGVSPMCQYSSEDGFANDWHLVHLGSRAQGGAGLVMLEASAVLPEGRISPGDLGVWKDEHIPGLERIAKFVHAQGARAGIQLAHAGRKGSMSIPFGKEQLVLPEEGGWQPVGPSPVAFSPQYAVPAALDKAGIDAVVDAFRAAARRALQAGFDLVEIHAAHGYLIHEFLSPLANRRSDEYGGSLQNRSRIALAIVDAVRSEWPQHLPVFMRISATDWAEGGWNPDESVELARHLREHGVDLVDVSSGGMVPHATIPVGPGYQVPFAARIRREAGVATAAVGMITEPEQASQIVEKGEADLVMLAREMLRDPYWPLHAAAALGETATWPKQYLRAAPAHSQARVQAAQPEAVSSGPSQL